MNEILLVPEWMGYVHWLVLVAVFWGLTGYCWGLVCWYRQAASLAYAVLTLCLAGISTCFWLIQIEVGIDPVVLFAVERILWWPLIVALVALIDIHAAAVVKRDSYLVRFRAGSTAGVTGT